MITETTIPSDGQGEIVKVFDSENQRDVETLLEIFGYHIVHPDELRRFEQPMINALNKRDTAKFIKSLEKAVRKFKKEYKKDVRRKMSSV